MVFTPLSPQALSVKSNWEAASRLAKPSLIPSWHQKGLPYPPALPLLDKKALPRHPSQLYQGLTEGVLLFLFIRYYEAKKIKSKTLRRGEVGGVFLIGYAILRFLVEYTRQPDEQLGLVLVSLSMGQILCLVMGMIGVAILIHSHKTQPYYKTRS